VGRARTVRRPTRRARSARASRRYEGFSYGGWSFRERTAELRAFEERRSRPTELPSLPRVWGVRIEFRPLEPMAAEPPPVLAPRVPKALRVALVGTRELFGEADSDGWQLFRDGVAIGKVSRPVPVPMGRLVPPVPVAIPATTRPPSRRARAHPAPVG
jgi:hypothetical protein